MKKNVLIPVVVLLLVLVGFYGCRYAVAAQKNISKHTWLKPMGVLGAVGDSGSDNWTIEKKKTYSMGDDVLQTGFHTIDGHWFYVRTSRYHVDCNFLKRCAQESVDYYQISDDMSGFQVLSSDYAKDSQRVFYKKNVVAGAVPDSFHFPDPNNPDYAADVAHVYYQGKALPQAMPDTFRLLGKRGEIVYSADAQRVYLNERVIEGAKTPDFRLFEPGELPEYMGYFWAHDASHLYDASEQLPVELNMSRFKHLAGYLFTDGEKVVELGGMDRIKQRVDITLPVRAIAPFIVVDGKQQVFVNDTIGRPVLFEQVDGASLKLVVPSCPSSTYMYMTVDCAKALLEDAWVDYFEDQAHVYFARFNREAKVVPGYKFVPVIGKVPGEPVYSFNVKGTQVVLHNGMLCHNNIWNQGPNDIACTKIVGELMGGWESVGFLADEAGFISLNRVSEQDPQQLKRVDTQEEFGSLRLYKQPMPQASYTLENDVFIYVFWPVEEREKNLLINKKTQTVSYMQSKEQLSTQDSQKVLEALAIQQ